MTSLINFTGSAEGTTILEWSGGMPQEYFAKLHLKIQIFVHSGSKFQYNAFTRLTNEKTDCNIPASPEIAYFVSPL